VLTVETWLESLQYHTTVHSVTFSTSIPLSSVLYDVWAKNFKALSTVNRLLKYADDTTLLVPSQLAVDLADEFENVKQWPKIIE